jgi:undecaprenyl-diphosphatase
MEIEVEIIKAIILGIIQGLTEFLPVSSSGHLVIFSELLGFKEQGIAFEVFLHLGTLVAVLIYFRKEIVQLLIAPYQIWIKKDGTEENKEYLNWDIQIIIATIPAVIIGLAFKDQIEAAFSNVFMVYFMLIITGLLMFSIPYIKQRDNKITVKRSFLIGMAQAFAILPGISRSGSTIFTGVIQGIKSETAAKFSFLMSVPVILGAVILKTKDLLEVPPSSAEMMNLIVGTIASAIAGYFAIIWIMDFVKKGKLQWFGYYCFAIAAIGIITSLM